MELSEISKVLEKHDPSFNRFDLTLSHIVTHACADVLIQKPLPYRNN